SLLVDAIGEITGNCVICTSPGLAQFAVAAARNLPQASVACTYLDAYRAQLAIDHWPDLPSNLRFECATDVPDDTADVVDLTLAASGEAELARELIQAAHQRLSLGGRLFATTDRREDQWLGQQLLKLFGKVESRLHPADVMYVATKTEPLSKIKNYACEFA